MRSAAQKWLHGLSNTKPDELDVKELLSCYDIATPAGLRLGPNDSVAIRNMQPPYVVKVCSGDILHKTDQGGVRLNVQPDRLENTITEMRAKFPGVSVLVEEHVHVSGSELIVGGLVDQEFGTAVMVGAGGILTELYQDVTFRLAPCSAEEARRMLNELQIAPLFSGYRGLNLDADLLAKTVAAISRMVIDLGDVFSQLDINPLGWVNNKWMALDAKLVLNSKV
ncbi:MAG: hypothetical protein A2341_11750 [Deltaproteobacteria bacterium RIFOXYB12_FULL_58_9]|nr:MAG: hypothetical protein A2341_11750 [Deltaproteobacteria bacterium RIFOXYB12_FULL_58_9]